MAAQQSQGIATLLEAEKEAAKIVQAARAYRVQKLKDARAEAAREIEAYKSSKEQEFAAHDAEHASDTTSAQASIDSSTTQALATLNASFEQNRDAVVDKLLDRVVKVELGLHKNLRKVEA